MQMKLNGEELKNVDHFKYLGYVIGVHTDGTIDRYMDIRVQAAWSSWRKLTGVSYDRKIPHRLKAKVLYEAIMRQAQTYGSECWTMKVNNKRNIATMKMRMRSHLNVETGFVFVGLDVSKVEIEQCHSQSDGPVSNGYQTTGTRQEDIARTEKYDMMGVGVTRDMALDRKEWRRRNIPTPRI